MAPWDPGLTCEPAAVEKGQSGSTAWSFEPALVEKGRNPLGGFDLAWIPALVEKGCDPQSYVCVCGYLAHQVGIRAATLTP